MAGLDPEISFVPAVESEFGEENVIVVKDALGGQPIRRWYKGWMPEEGDEPNATGDLYDSLMTKVSVAMEGRHIESVTFLWMQGERDARESHGTVYARSLMGLIEQLKGDLGRDEIFVIIGRLSDFDMSNERYPHWTLVREAQVSVTEALPRAKWVNTDDLNDGLNARGEEIVNDLHYSVDGYRTFGERLATAAIGLIRSNIR